MAGADGLIALRFPLPWEDFDFPNPLQTRSTVLTTGDIGWAWSADAPDLEIPPCDVVPGESVAGWDLDHVVVLVPDLEDAIVRFSDVGLSSRLKLEVRGRPTAFFRAGPLIEVIESPVRAPALYGIALVTETPLEVIALRWRSLGREVADPRPAIQPGRRIMVVRAVEAGLAVMSPDRSPS